MSSHKNSLKTHSEFSPNSESDNIQNNNNNNINTDILEKSINLNEFLDFLNLSCHVNDMISSQYNDEHQRQYKELNQTGKFMSEPMTSGCENYEKTCETHTSINFEKLAQNRLVNDLYGFNHNLRSPGDCIKQHNASGTADTSFPLQRNAIVNTKPKSSNYKESENLHVKLNDKLDYVLNEGILDAVLPFICPIPLPPNYTTRLKLKQTKDSRIIAASASTALTSDISNEIDTTAANKDSSIKVKGKIIVAHNNNITLNSASIKDPEVLIHVCDEDKNISKDFTCSQSLLVSKMGYFADITAGQKLEDIDISVHCDIHIFEWLMKWVKSEFGHNCNITSMDSNCTNAPYLNVNNVISILVSSSFLQMEPLQLDCLTFCHSRLADVVRNSGNLPCLSEPIVTRMADMFTNVELEMVGERKNRLIHRLWTKLISSLFEPETEALRGHYYSLAGLFKCSKCHKCLTNTMKSYIQCIPGNVRLNRWGQIVSHHIRDPSWDVNYYITQLFKEVKSWRLVYWKLWGHAHYLYCCLCEMYFPVYQMSWCRYHPEPPSFLGPVAEGRTTGPAGRYACCSQQAFRYEALPGPHGCQFREHSVLVETDGDRSILSIVQLVMEGNALADCPPHRLQETFANREIEPRWKGISLMPHRCRQGLLPTLNPGESTYRVDRRVKPSAKYFADSSTETESTDTLDNVRLSKFGKLSYNECFSSSESDGCESSDSNTFPPKKSYHKKQNRKSKLLENSGRYWSGELSARSNQDHQREYEEKIMKQVMDMVQKKTALDLTVSQTNRPLGGTYVKLEQEWKQRIYTLGGISSTTNLSNISNSNSASNNKFSRKKVDTSGQ